jgi:calcineurin-like phosphoesterase family protein
MPRPRVTLAFALLVAVTSVVLSCGDPPSAAPRAGSIVWAVGDGGNGSDEARTLERVIARDNPRRVLYLGDVYEHGTATDFRERFETVYGPLAARMDPTPGNHDWPNHATGYDPYWRKVKGRPLAHRYAFSLGGWRIVSLNSETPDNAAQLRFARRQVKGRRCVLAFMHRPRFNAGMHHDEERDVEKLWQALRGRARLLLSGHDHNLQRFKRVDGTTQFVIGAGGRERYAVNDADPRLAYSNDHADGALRIQLQPGVARLRIVRADGRVLDRSTVRC